MSSSTTPNNAATSDTTNGTKSGRAWLIAFLVTPLAALLFACLSLGVFTRGLDIPFEYGHDSFIVSVPVKTMVDHGWWYENPQLGAPLELNFYDYPCNPNVHIAIFKAMALLEHDTFRLVNYYLLLSFPLIAVCTLAALKTIRLSVLPSVVLCLLFTFAPYHFWRGVSHLWLAAYFPVPLAMIMIVWVFQNRSGVIAEIRDGRWRWTLFSIPTMVCVAICAILGFDFPYYPMFAAFLLLVAGLYMAIGTRSWLPIVRSSALISGIAVFLVLNLLPNLLYQWEHGKNPSPSLITNRPWTDAETFGLKIASLLLPAENHPIRPLDRLRQRYQDGTVARSSGGSPALGTIGAIGFLSLLYWHIFRQHRDSSPKSQVMDWMSMLTVATLLLATIGGLGTVFNLLTTGILRCYDRFSIFLLFFSLVPVGFWLERVYQHMSQRSYGRLAFAALLATMTGWGMYEQSRHLGVDGLTDVAAFESDRDFVKMIEADAGAKGRIYQYPLQNFFSYNGPAIAFDPYTHFRGYLHSKSLTWSFGAMVGRPPAAMQNWIDAQEPKEAAATLSLMEFDGIYIDRKLYQDHGVEIEAKFQEVLGRAPVVSKNERLSYFSLSDYYQNLKSKYTPEEFAALREKTTKPVLVEWEGLDVEEPGIGERFRWSNGKNACLRISNTSQANKEMTLDFGVASSRDEASTLSVQGPGISDSLQINGQRKQLTHKVTVPPGITRIVLKSDVKPLQTSSRNVTFRVCDFSCVASDNVAVAGHPSTKR